MTQGVLQDIRKTVRVKASLAKVWETVATAEGIAAWWMDNTFVPAEGALFVLRSGQFGDSPCKVTGIEPLHRLDFDWGKDWHITFELKLLEDGLTEFTLIHSGWDAAKNTEFGQSHSVIRGVMDGGWESIVNHKLVQAIEA